MCLKISNTRLPKLYFADAANLLLQYNCGLCGAPDCRTLAADIASGKSQKTDCIFFSKDSLERLKRIHLKPKA
jgi:Na+-translocating ferredoxin:NAD+ oxidoreductase RNF subunit RnfB